MPVFAIVERANKAEREAFWGFRKRGAELVPCEGGLRLYAGAGGLKLGLIGFVFPGVREVAGLHNPFCNRWLGLFWGFAIWVCFA